MIVVPHKDATFDHMRPVTSMQHLIDDCSSDTIVFGKKQAADEVVDNHIFLSENAKYRHKSPFKSDRKTC